MFRTMDDSVTIAQVKVDSSSLCTSINIIIAR